MPLAVKRLTVADLPVTVELSDADAMIPSMKLSAFDKIVVGARISKSGQPIAQPGDFFIEMDNVDRIGATDIINLSNQRDTLILITMRNRNWRRFLVRGL